LTSHSDDRLPDRLRVRVWDLPTRLFHWLLLAGVVTAFISVKLGGNAMVWHGRAGTFVLSLLIFRLLWGFIGSPTARFQLFLKGPKTVWRYIQGQTSGNLGTPESPVTPGTLGTLGTLGHASIGHNPLGALSVVALLGLFFFQTLTGLGTSDDIFFDGPLAKDLGSDTVSLLTSLHKSTEPFLLGLVALHVAAIVFYRLVKKTDLVQPMITGVKVLETHAEKPSPLGTSGAKELGITEGPSLWLKALTCWLIALALVTSLG
jgi:cytochrome b